MVERGLSGKRDVIVLPTEDVCSLSRASELRGKLGQAGSLSSWNSRCIHRQGKPM